MSEPATQPLPVSRGTFFQSIPLVALRVVIGWHFLYEGLAKLTDPAWSSAPYLSSSRWLLADQFHQIAANPDWLRAVDLANMFGLTLIGLGLMLGCLTRIASLAGVLLLGLYYCAQPPFLLSSGRMEGSYLFLDKNAVEGLGLLALAFLPAGHFWGVDGWMASAWRRRRALRARRAQEASDELEPALPRREWLRHLVPLPVAGAFVYAFEKKRGWSSFEVKHLAQWKRESAPDAMSGATIKTFKFAQLNELQAPIPKSRIGNMELSRVILGGNLIGGWAHARDLIYASNLVKAYHTDDKVFETFQLAEQCGINTVLTNPLLCRVITDYWKKVGGKIKFISDCGGSDVIESAQRSIDAGAHACYVQGATADRLVAEQDFDTIAKLLDLTRRSGLPAGIGAHYLDTVKGCVEKGLKPDFWMKTLHKTNYWSAQPQPEHDNIWCTNPDDTVAYMEQLPEPWIAFKTLAAGALHPSDAFSYAFSSGADFICVGMYDFQLVENANLFHGMWPTVQERKRVWRA